jgi:methionyl-tRNA synthetase
MLKNKMSEIIKLEDFKKIDIVVGKILSAEKIPETDKLLKLSVDIGEDTPRTIVSGISLYFPDCSVLVGKKCMFVANLEPRIIRGIESKGMLFAVSGGDTMPKGGQGDFSLLEPDDSIKVGSRAK